jgi:hypothetical protein
MAGRKCWCRSIGRQKGVSFSLRREEEEGVVVVFVIRVRPKHS